MPTENIIIEAVIPNYRRVKSPGATYFFTVVTYERQRILCEPVSRVALRDAIHNTQSLHPFLINVWVLLPDHLHCLWTLPDGDYDFSKRWGMIKSNFTKRMKQVGWASPTENNQSPSRIRHRVKTIWVGIAHPTLRTSSNNWGQQCPTYPFLDRYPFCFFGVFISSAQVMEERFHL